MSINIAVVGTACQQVWTYRKAAWAIEDLDVDIGLIYRQMVRKGLESIPNVGPRLARVIADQQVGRILRLTNAGSKCTLYLSVIPAGDRLGLATT